LRVHELGDTKKLNHVVSEGSVDIFN